MGQNSIQSISELRTVQQRVPLELDRVSGWKEGRAEGMS